MDFELVEVRYTGNTSTSCFPDFFDDCNPTDDACIPNEMNDEEI